MRFRDALTLALVWAGMTIAIGAAAYRTGVVDGGRPCVNGLCPDAIFACARAALQCEERPAPDQSDNWVHHGF